MKPAEAKAQRWSAETNDAHARFVSDLAGEVLAWHNPKAGERVLDLGCGDGVLTAELVSRGVEVVGVDTSDDLLLAAKTRGLDVCHMDGQALQFDAEFDAVFSNAALHWMRDAAGVVSGVARALKPGGRFVAEFGGHGNVAAIVTAILAIARARGVSGELAAPWFYPTPAEYRDLLENAGFTVRRIGLFPRPTPLKTGMTEWLKLFRKPFFEQFGMEAEKAVAECVDLLRPSLCDSHGDWTADYVRIRVDAVK